MQNTKLSSVKGKRQFTEILGRVALGRETFTIIRRGKPVAVTTHNHAIAHLYRNRALCLTAVETFRSSR